MKGAPTGERRKAVRFAVIAGAIALSAMIGFALLTRLEVFGAGFEVNFALVLGVLGTVGLGVGLMALVFYSARSGADNDQASGVSNQVSDDTDADRHLTPDT